MLAHVRVPFDVIVRDGHQLIYASPKTGDPPAASDSLDEPVEAGHIGKKKKNVVRRRFVHHGLGHHSIKFPPLELRGINSLHDRPKQSRLDQLRQNNVVVALKLFAQIPQVSLGAGKDRARSRELYP